MLPRSVLAVALLLVVLLPAACDPGDAEQRLVKFHRVYDPFMRQVFGCPEKAREFVECTPGQGQWDQRGYLRARAAAKELFDLVERER